MIFQPLRKSFSILFTAFPDTLRAFRLLQAWQRRALLRCGSDQGCPLYPQKRTSELSRGMSALCQKRTSRHRRLERPKFFLVVLDDDPNGTRSKPSNWSIRRKKLEIRKPKRLI